MIMLSDNNIAIKFSTSLKDMFLATIKNMPPDVNLVQVQGLPSFFISRIMLSKEEATQKNLLRLEVIRSEEGGEYLICQRL